MTNESEYMARVTIEKVGDFRKPTDFDLKCKFGMDNKSRWHMKVYVRSSCFWKCWESTVISDRDCCWKDKTKLFHDWIHDIWNGKDGKPIVKKLIIYS